MLGISSYKMSVRHSLFLSLLLVGFVHGDVSVECGDGFTFGDHIRIVTLDSSISSTELITVHYSSTSKDHEVSIQIFDSEFKPKTNALPIGNPKHVDATTEDPNYILSIFPNNTCTLSMHYFVKPDRVTLRSPNLIHRLFAWNENKIYALTDWFSSFIDTEPNPYDIYGTLYISHLSNHAITSLWFNRPSNDPPYATTLEFTVVNASNGAVLVPSPDHIVRVNGSTSTEWDSFGINVCYQRERGIHKKVNQWTILYDTCPSSDYCKNHGITYQLKESDVESVSDLKDWPTHYQGDSISQHCWQYSEKEIAICTTYAPTTCGIYNPVTMQNVSELVDTGIMYDPGVGEMILVKDEEEKPYLVNCYLNFFNYMQCDVLDIQNGFKVLIKGEYLFDINCCDQQLNFVMTGDADFVLSTTTGLNTYLPSTVQNCTVKFDA